MRTPVTAVSYLLSADPTKAMAHFFPPPSTVHLQDAAQPSLKLRVSRYELQDNLLPYAQKISSQLSHPLQPFRLPETRHF